MNVYRYGEDRRKDWLFGQKIIVGFINEDDFKPATKITRALGEGEWKQISLKIAFTVNGISDQREIDK
jgi:hypothetical protein